MSRRCIWGFCAFVGDIWLMPSPLYSLPQGPKYLTQLFLISIFLSPSPSLFLGFSEAMELQCFSCLLKWSMGIPRCAYVRYRRKHQSSLLCGEMPYDLAAATLRRRWLHPPNTSYLLFPATAFCTVICNLEFSAGRRIPSDPQFPKYLAERPIFHQHCYRRTHVSMSNPARFLA